jgi:malate dehydrogenase (oxaloacetate-decarboxylating)
MSGAGAAGTAVIKLLLAAGARNVVVADIAGVVHRGRDDLTGELEWLAQHTNRLGFTGSLKEAVVGADIFIGVSAPGVLSGSDVAAMADRSIVFALANPEPEIDPAEATQYAAVVATGRSDFPNQINNVLAFPGVFRGLLDAHSAEITSTMLLAAARALAAVVSDDELNAAYIVPSVFHADVHHAVAQAVRRAAGGPTELPSDTEVAI